MMMLPVANIGKVLSLFVEKQVLPSASNPWQIAGTVFVGTALAHRGSNISDSAKSALQMLGVMKDDLIDVEFAYELAKEAINRVGILNIFGVDFDASDLDALHTIAKSQSREVSDGKK